MLTELVKLQLVWCLELIFLRDIVAVFTNRTDESNNDAMFTFFWHRSNYTVFEAELKYLSRQWESDPCSSPYQGLVLPLNYVGKCFTLSISFIIQAFSFVLLTVRVHTPNCDF